MAAFATVADLATFLDETIPDGDARATLVLELASAAVQAYTGQTIFLVEDDTITVRGFGRKLLSLPQLPVRAVSSVAVAGTALDAADWTWSDLGLLRRSNAASWGLTDAVDIVYTHGYAAGEIPDAIRLVTLQIAARGFANPAVAVQEAIGNYSVTYGSSAGPDLSVLEMRTLDAFRFRGLA